MLSVRNVHAIARITGFCLRRQRRRRCRHRRCCCPATPRTLPGLPQSSGPVRRRGRPVLWRRHSNCSPAAEASTSRRRPRWMPAISAGRRPLPPCGSTGRTRWRRRPPAHQSLPLSPAVRREVPERRRCCPVVGDVDVLLRPFDARILTPRGSVHIAAGRDDLDLSRILQTSTHYLRWLEGHSIIGAYRV